MNLKNENDLEETNDKVVNIKQQENVRIEGGRSM